MGDPPRQGLLLEAGTYRDHPEQEVTSTRPRLPLRRRELVAVGLWIGLVDITLLGTEGWAAGGFGLAAAFLSVPALLLSGARQWRSSWRLGVLSAGLVLVSVRSAIDPTPLTTLSGVVLALALAIVMRAPRGTPEVILVSVAKMVPALPQRIRAAAVAFGDLLRTSRIGSGTVAATAVPAALTLMFLGVFALANPLVERSLWRVLDAVGNSAGLPHLPRVFAWLVTGVVGLALVRPSIARGLRKGRVAAIGQPSAGSLLVVRNSLACLTLLFLAYLALDVTELVAGGLPQGMAETQRYAHQGAIWLTVALALMTVVVGVFFHGALAHAPSASHCRRLALIWIGLGLLLAIATYWRIVLHVATSGLSDLRFLGVGGTTLVVAGVILVGLKLRGRRTLGWLIGRQLDAFAIATVIYAVTPTHHLGAQVNTARILEGANAPLMLVSGQAAETESASALIPLLDHPDPRVVIAVATQLKAARAELRAELRSRAALREHDLLSARTLALLDAHGPRLQAYGHEDTVHARATLEALSMGLEPYARSLEDAPAR